MSFSRVRSAFFSAAIVACLAPALAVAQPTPPPRDQSFTFGDELVQSSLRVSDGATARGRVPRSGATLIRHRAHFVPEMLRSVERL
jgi:hypothetical protein